MLRSLGRSPSVTQILDKLRGIYGPVDTGSDLLERFCRQVQGGGMKRLAIGAAGWRG